MYLKTLEINGFKSFARKTKMDFKTKISSIVGPNGSGKSNVAESFRFVLGEQSMKNMRGKKGEDLIFAGKTGRINRGSVKVVFDNSDKTLNLDYDEVVIERVVFRDGVNEYYINDTKVRAKDVLELLTSANIGSSGHHIISQGEADKILSIPPKERKSVIEEALGLKSFVLKKAEAERKLEKTIENLQEVITREKINAPRIRFLEKEVVKINKVKDMREEIKRLYSLYFPTKKKIEQKILELNENFSKKELERREIESQIEKRRIELKNSRNTDADDKQRNVEISRIQLEIKNMESEKEDLQRALVKNEIFIEDELRKEKEYNLQKGRVKDNLKKYNAKLNSISAILHELWIKWSKNILKSEDISKERRDEWTNNFIDFNNLSEELQNKDKEFSIKILEFFNIRESGVGKENFDLKLVEEKRINNTIITKKINTINEILESLSKKIRILNSNTEDAGEVLSQEIEIEILKMEKMLSVVLSEITSINSNKYQLEREINNYNQEEVHVVNIFGHEALKKFLSLDDSGSESLEKNIFEKIMRVRILLEDFGQIESENILEEYNELKERQNFIKKEMEDLNSNKDKLNQIIIEVTNEIEVKFRSGVEKINSEFSKFFSTLFSGGSAEIFLIEIPIKKVDEDDIQEFELGLDIKVSLPNKKINGLGMLSGGERSLTSIALLFAMSSITPPPFIILDETDAALDEANSKRYGDMVEKLAEHSQLILITHNRETMSRAGLLYGVTMGSEGISKLLSISFEEAEKVAK